MSKKEMLVILLVISKRKGAMFSHNPLIIRWELTGSNRRPSACKADALNQLS